MRLPEAKHAVFNLYCSWVYFGSLREPTCTKESDPIDRNAEQHSLADLYLLGDSLDEIELRNQASLKFFKSMRTQDKVPSLLLLTRVWESTHSGSSLRKILVDVDVSLYSRAEFADDVYSYPVEFVQEVAVAALQVRTVMSWDDVAQRLPRYKEAEKSE